MQARTQAHTHTIDCTSIPSIIHYIAPMLSYQAIHFIQCMVYTYTTLGLDRVKLANGALCTCMHSADTYMERLPYFHGALPLHAPPLSNRHLSSAAHTLHGHVTAYTHVSAHTLQGCRSGAMTLHLAPTIQS